MMNKVCIIGGGLAGVEAAWQLANAGIPVALYEMKPLRYSPAHTQAGLAELVCSNSLKALRIASAAGMLKAEMELLGSLCVPIAKQTAVPAGGALAVDRNQFSALITEKITAHPYITVIREEVTAIPPEGIVIVAAGPLASPALSAHIRQLTGNALSFYDAAAPIVTAESIDRQFAFLQSRYDRGGAEDYINCPLDQAQYDDFYHALLAAERAELHEFDARKDVYEGCMPVEVLASRGKDSLRYGPMKPVGLRDPRTGHRPWAVLQLRKENAVGSLYNLVGFQTNLKFAAQKSVFSRIPALRNAEYVRYGVMHRNTFLDSPRVLNAHYQSKARPTLFFAGQITGVEGYMESAASGILCGINALHLIKGEDLFLPPPETIAGALSRYISDSSIENFQPMGANFGILPPLPTRIREKQERYAKIAQRGLALLEKALI